MKKIVSFALAACMLLSIVPIASATRDYTQGTQVVYTSNGTESYTITVPALLAPGGDGTVTLSGTWAENRVVTVTAEPIVTLKNSIKETDTKTLNVNFDGISEAGSNTGSQTFTESVSVDNITNALFGTWSGKFNYNVEISNVASETGCDTLYWDGNTEGKLIIEDMFVKVSDSIVLMNDLKNGFSIYLNKNGEEMGAACPADSVADWVVESGDMVGFVDLMAICIASDNLTVEAGVILYDKEVVFPEKGVYLPIKLFWAGEEVPGEGAFRLTIPGYTGFQHSEHCGH